MRQDIEASVIGGLLIGGLTPTASDVLATLEPEAFSIPLYRKAFEVIRKQARNRNLIDALMVAEACGEEHFTSILMTSKNCPSAANLKGYAGMVADNYHRRLVLEIMDEMREPIQSGTIDASSQAMDELVKRLSAIRKPRDEVKPVRLGEIITDYTDTLDRRLRNGEESDTLKTGIEELDAITGGMNAEDLVIIAARPGMGKTELALKIAEGVASRVIPGSDVRRGVLIFSMEMSALQIAERSIANAGRMSVSVLRNPASMDDEGWARVANGMSQLADLDVWVVDASRLSVEEIRSIAERHKQENPNLSLIMVDYLGLIEKPKADRNDLAIAHISGSRPDNVKISIERLAKSGVIQLPALQVFEKINNLGLRRSVEAYVFEGEQGKRDSIIVVAQLSPEFTARLVDRWRELEEAAVNIPKTLPEALRLAADLAEQKMQLENQLAIAAPKVEFADRVGEASGILIGNFAKVVGIGPNKLFAWMRDHKILIASGSRRNVPMQEYMERGYFTVKETAVNTNHGIQISFTTKITGRGQQWLTRKLLDNGMLKVTGEAA